MLQQKGAGCTPLQVLRVSTPTTLLVFSFPYDLPLPIGFFLASLAYDFFSVFGPLRHPALISFLLPFPSFSQRKYIDVAPGTDFEKRDDVQVGINVQNSHLSGI